MKWPFKNLKFACWNKNNKNKNNKKLERLRNNSLRFLRRLIIKHHINNAFINSNFSHLTLQLAAKYIDITVKLKLNMKK